MHCSQPLRNAGEWKIIIAENMKTNRINLKALLCAAMVTAMAWGTAHGVPARRGYYTVTQPDGTTLTIHKSGDEVMHFVLTADDKIVTRDADGKYSYGRLDADGALVSTGIQAVEAAHRPAAHEYLTTSLDQIDRVALLKKRTGKATMRTLGNKEAAAKYRRMARRNTMNKVIVNEDGTVTNFPQKGLGRFTSNFPNKGKIKGLVLLVEFSDVKVNTSYANGAHAYFTDLLTKPGFSEYGGTGSATEFFTEQSMGQFEPEFTLVGPITLPYSCAYYGGNDAWGNDKLPEQMVIDACKAIDAQLDFTEYDNDNDGFVDNVFVFYAGQGENAYGDANTIWPHSWEISNAGKKLTLDGVRIDRYACSNEWNMATPDGIGTFVHEFSHVMGLPDLYPTGAGSGVHTPGAYSVMDAGSYNNDSRTPPAYSAYERNAMGWLAPYLIDGTATMNLENIIETNQAALIATDSDNEFFLLENRRNTSWDTYIPGHGMLVWHIDFNQNIFDSNIVNNNSSHSYVDIVEACGGANNMSPAYMAGYTFPGSRGVTSLTADTTPALKTWNGTGIALPITDIEEDEEIIRFNVSGGTFGTPVATEAIDRGKDWFIATWNPVDGASDYLLTVHAIKQSVPESTETANFTAADGVATLPAGWTSTATEVYTTSSSYKSAPSSLKFNADGQCLETREFDGDISALSFWIIGKGALTPTSKLTVEGQIGDRWVPLTVTEVTSVAQTVELNDIPEGVRKISFTFNMDKGMIALDDVSVTSGGVTDYILPAYNAVSTGGAPQMRVQDLPADVSHYSYQVAATDGRYVSKLSNAIDVELETGGVDNIVADEAATTVVAINGHTIAVTTGASRVRVFNSAGLMVANVPVSDGMATLTLPSSGFYIVHAGDRAVKVALH